MHIIIFFVLVLLAGFATSCRGDASTNRECVAQCSNKQCGTDGCGGICGVCGPGTACSDEFRCESSFCGNGRVDPGESCDSAITSGAGVCPTECEDDGNVCTQTNYSGNPLDCDARCATFVIIRCIDGDGCCPDGCSPMTDLDCSANCGNGEIDEGETCDPPSSCPTLADCDDNDACTTDSLTGSATNCSAQCLNLPVTQCINGDGCCPVGCTLANDDDCEFVCGDGEVTGPETCDNAIDAGMEGACPENEAECDDNDACTINTLEGSAALCTALCQSTAITACVDDDGCCPPTCTSANDNDCVAVCGNGVVEVGETCDPIASCPTACDDNNACTTNTLVGDAALCTADCVFTPITTCNPTADQCCPSNCTPGNDGDCASLCQTYCDLAETNCPDIYTLYVDRPTCITACEAMVVGLQTDDSENTLYCRINQLELAENDAATYCPFGGQDGGTMCVN